MERVTRATSGANTPSRSKKETCVSYSRMQYFVLHRQKALFYAMTSSQEKEGTAQAQYMPIVTLSASINLGLYSDPGLKQSEKIN